MNDDEAQARIEAHEIHFPITMEGSDLHGRCRCGARVRFDPWSAEFVVDEDMTTGPKAMQWPVTDPHEIPPDSEDSWRRLCEDMQKAVHDRAPLGLTEKQTELFEGRMARLNRIRDLPPRDPFNDQTSEGLMQKESYVRKFARVLANRPDRKEALDEEMPYLRKLPQEHTETLSVDAEGYEVVTPASGRTFADHLRAKRLAEYESADETIAEETIAEEAVRIVGGERREDYGDTRESFQRIADYWNVHLKTVMVKMREYDWEPDQPIECIIEASDVACMMDLMKTSRETGGNHKRDNLVDKIGYVILWDRLLDES